jgi:hypothetical protein
VTDPPVLAATAWPTNAELIADVARLGYLRAEWATLDPTYGRGVWWQRWRPTSLTASDLDPAKSPTGTSVDFRSLPHGDASFMAVAFDPPYKLNGTPTAGVDARYGVDAYTSRDDRHLLLVDGMAECARVLAPGGTLLVKCQDQVNSGRVRWQTDLVTDTARLLGLEKVDAFLMLSYRPQPAGRRQEHARRNYSTLFVFRAGRR